MSSSRPAKDEGARSARKRRSLTRLLIFRWLPISFVCALVLVAVALLWLYGELRSSLPVLDGELNLRGLSAPVTIERDRLGVPTVTGSDRIDVARATGFLHGQERFFQMDLSRRRAAGELAELFGAPMIPMDEEVRLHRFRSKARGLIDFLPLPDRRMLEAYAEGVEAGLEALGARPFEYRILREKPSPWLPEDSLLVVFNMYLALQDQRGGFESACGLIHDLLPRELYEFLVPAGTDWDAPIVGEPIGSRPIPGPEVLDLRVKEEEAGRNKSRYRMGGERERIVPGSNSWAVAGAESAHGGAILANEVHLGLSVPNIWYRASIVYPDDGGRRRRVTGVTLPGVPAVVVGSNGSVAWGFTNSFGDWSDLVVIEAAPGDPDAYLTPDGPRKFDVYHETIRVKGERERDVEARWTVWGPVIDEDHKGRPRALRWVAHDREAVDLGLIRIESAETVEEAIRHAGEVGIPAQNLVVAGSRGDIGWTVVGPIPRRFGHDGRLPASWAGGRRGWDGWLEPREYPRVVNPEGGRLWTANARVVGGSQLALLGDGGYVLGARAAQIRDDLLSLREVTEEDMLAVQLDDDARFLERWRDLLLQVLSVEALEDDPRRKELRMQVVTGWKGRASVDSVGFRMVRAFRQYTERRVFDPLVAVCREGDEDFRYYRIPQREGPLWEIVRRRPSHLLNRRYETWRELFLDAVDDMLDYFTKEGAELSERTWGERNVLSCRHPLSHAIPMVGRWLDMPEISLPGDSFMPRVQGRSFGASLRMVVSPGREEEGIFHMPCGQSGHPLSTHYRDGHEAWVKGERTPFLPAAPLHRLVLKPDPVK